MKSTKNLQILISVTLGFFFGKNTFYERCSFPIVKLRNMSLRRVQVERQNPEVNHKTRGFVGDASKAISKRHSRGSSGAPQKKSC